MSKLALRLFLSNALCLAVAGCGSSGSDEPVSTGPSPGEPVGAGEGGTATLLFWQAPTLVNPYLSGGTKEQEAASLVLEPLAEYNDAVELVPALAVDIPTLENGGISEDLTRVTWVLRPDVVWSDGTPLTAEDVVFTWRYCTDPDGGCAVVSRFDGVADVVAIDDRTVEIVFDGPKPVPYGPFVSSWSPILQRDQFADCVGEAGVECSDENFYPVGTGPYRVAEFRVNDTIRYEFNPLYRGVDQGLPFFGEILIKGGGDAAAAARSVLQLGEADYAWNLQVEPEILNQMQSAGRGILVSDYSTSVEHLMLNQTNPDASLGELRSEFAGGTNPHPFLTDPVVGRALSLAIDRNVLVAIGYSDVAGRPTCNIWPAPADEVSPNNTECLAQDMDLANRILDEAGIIDSNGDGIREREGVPLEILFQTSTNPVRQTTQELIKSWWSEIGVETELKSIDASVFFGDDPSSPDTSSKFYADVQMYTNNAAGPDSEGYLGQWTSDKMPGRVNSFLGQNDSRFHSDEFDALVAELLVTADIDRRNEIIIALNDLLVQSYAVIPLIHRADVSAHASDISGFRMSAWDAELWNIEMWRRIP